MTYQSANKWLSKSNIANVNHILKIAKPSIQLHHLPFFVFLATGLAVWDAIDYVDCQHMPCTGEAESKSLTLNKHRAAPGHPAF